MTRGRIYLFDCKGLCSMKHETDYINKIDRVRKKIVSAGAVITEY